MSASSGGLAKTLPVALSALVLALALAGAGRRHLWEPDETLSGERYREMAATGDRLVPRFGGVRDTAKPPAWFWLMEASAGAVGTRSALFGVLPAALSAGALLALLAFLPAPPLAGEAGRLGALVLGTSLLGILAASACRMDAAFVLLISGAILCGAGSPVSARPRLAAAGGLAGLAVLIKGPWGLVMPAAVLAAFWASERRRPRLGGLLLGLLAALAVLAAWLVPAISAEGSGYLAEILEEQFLRRTYGVPSANHPHGPLYFLWSFPLCFLPWTPFLPHAVWLAARRREPADRLLLAWLAAPLLLLSIPSGKMHVYALPAFPAAALLVGRLLAAPSAAIPAPGLLRRILAAGGAAAAALGAFLAADLPAIPGLAPLLGKLSRQGLWIALLGAPGGGLALAGAVVATLSRRASLPPVALACAAIPALVLAGAVAWLIPAQDEARSHAALGARFREEAGGRLPLFVVGVPPRAAAWAFRTIPVDGTPEPGEGRGLGWTRAAARSRGACILLTDRYLEAIRRALPATRVLGEGRYRGRRVLLLRTSPPAPVPAAPPEPGGPG